MLTILEYVLNKTISSIDEYLLSKTNKNANSDNYYLIWPKLDMVQSLRNQYKDKRVYDKNGAQLWLVKTSELLDLSKKYEFSIYEMPDIYDHKSLTRFITNKNLDVHELKKLNINEI